MLPDLFLSVLLLTGVAMCGMGILKLKRTSPTPGGIAVVVAGVLLAFMPTFSKIVRDHVGEGWVATFVVALLAMTALAWWDIRCLEYRQSRVKAG